MIAVVTLSKTFFPQHPRKGEETHFREKVLAESKLHTCRQNFGYWDERINQLKDKGGVLSVRQWIGRPYKKPGQETVIDIPAEIVGVQRLELRREQVQVEFYAEANWRPVHKAINHEWTATVDGWDVPLWLLASNDGLTVEDFKAWFAPAFDKAEKKYPALTSLSGATTIEFAIIHFTKHRY